jgi:hypothetical protein
MRIQGLAGTAVSVTMVLSGAVRAEAEFRTDGLSGRQLKTWKAIVAVVEATGRDGQPLHPTLHRLYREIASSPHEVRIVFLALRGSSIVAGRFWLESVGSDGGHEAMIALNLRTIDSAQMGSPDAQLVTFETLGRTERQAQVLGHELAHAAWTFADVERVRLVVSVQDRSIELARRARTEGVAAEGFSAAVTENERLARELEEPALAAEAAIAEELRASRY